MKIEKVLVVWSGFEIILYYIHFHELLKEFWANKNE